LLLQQLLLRRAESVTTVPERPLLTPWFRHVADDDRLLLEHGQAVVVLEGAAVRSFLPALFPLLDGTNTVPDLVERLGPVTRPAVDLALETLASHGLLVEGPAVSAGVQATVYGLAATFDLAPALVAERLAGGFVGVVGSASAGVDVARMLRAAGLGRVTAERWDGDSRPDLAVVAPGADELDELDRWNRAANERDLRWLPVLPYDGRFAAVGPLIVPGESCCYECLLRRRAANLEYGDHLPAIERAPLTARADLCFETFVASVAAHLVLRWIGGQDGSLPGVLHALEARPTLALGAHDVLRVPRCPVCSPVERLAAPLPWHEAGASEAVAA
jgi:bacteriocin biosynthesis cyclodehydratase domain-containing protein